MHLEASRFTRVTPLAPRTPMRAVLPSAGSAAPSFAEVYDLAAERERRTVPEDALAAVDEAARVYEELDAAGLQVRFETTASGLRAQLRTVDGSFVRELSLREVVDPSSLLPPDAA